MNIILWSGQLIADTDILAISEGLRSLTENWQRLKSVSADHLPQWNVLDDVATLCLNISVGHCLFPHIASQSEVAGRVFLCCWIHVVVQSLKQRPFHFKKCRWFDKLGTSDTLAKTPVILDFMSKEHCS